jgi:cell division GTPase FtsZ
VIKQEDIMIRNIPKNIDIPPYCITRIKVIGVGGGGCKAAQKMLYNDQHVEFNFW